MSDLLTTPIPESDAVEASGSRPRSLTLNMGPQHPSTHGVLRLQAGTGWRNIVKCQPDIGYLHTGIEKEFEVKNYQQAVTLTDRIDYLAPLSNNLCYCLAVEKLLGLEIPPQAQWTRVMLTELTRLNSHLVWLGTHAIDIGAMSVFLYCFREREDILRIFEMYLRPAHDDQLFPHRRTGAGTAARMAAAGKDLHRSVPEQGGRVRRTADQQSHLDRTHARASATCRSKTCWIWASPGPCCAPPA